MNERIDFEHVVASHIAGEGVAPPDDAFYDELLSRAERYGQRPRWLALIREAPMRTSSHLTVGSPTARIAAVLITTVLLAASIVGAGLAGQRLLAAEDSDFPSGTFVAAEWSPRAVTFHDDGTCHWDFAPGVEAGMPCTYAVDGELYTETSYEWQSPNQYPPATYRWAFDGEQLTFELVGEDPSRYRRALYEEQPYRLVPDARVVLLAAYDITAGTELLAGHTVPLIVAGADVPAETLVDKDLATGRIATTDIAKGQPITPDLLAGE